MKNKLITLCTPFFVGFNFLVLVQQSEAAAPLASNPGFQAIQIEIATPKIYNSAENPVVLNVHLWNNRNKSLFYDDYARAMGDMTVEINGPDQKHVPLTAYGKHLHLYEKQTGPHYYNYTYGVSIASGKQAVYRLWLNRVFDLSIAGMYTVTVKKDIPRPDNVGRELVTSNTLIFYILEPSSYPYEAKPEHTPTKSTVTTSPSEGYQVQF